MKTFHIQTLGCKVNHYESDQIATLLQSRGLVPGDAASADLRVVNTCSVTTQAASQSRQSVRRMVRLPVLASSIADQTVHADGPMSASNSFGSPLGGNTRSACNNLSERPPAAIDNRSGQTSADGQSLAPSSAAASRRKPRVLVAGCWATSNRGDAEILPGVDGVVGHHQDVAAELDRLLARWQAEDKLSEQKPDARPVAPAVTKIITLGETENGQVAIASPADHRTASIEPKAYEAVNRKVERETGSPNDGETGTKQPDLQRNGRTEGATNAGSSDSESKMTGGRPLVIAAQSSLPSQPSSFMPQAARKAGASSLPLLNFRQPGRQRAFLKIQDGCNAHCTYCIIPSLRPKLWSKPVDSVVEEANSLIAAGHVELILTGIFLGAYGQPTALRRRQPQSTARPLGQLIDSLCTRVPGLRRLRLSSLEPGDLTNELIAVLRSHDAVVPHFHLPLQSGSDPLLRRMNRQYSRDDYLRMVERVNAAFDRPAITTDVVVGFPGESDDEFERTVEVVRTSGFIHVHAFPYSPRPGTAAARWTKQYVRGPIVNERIERLREIAAEQSLAYRRTFLGETVELIVERDNEDVSGHRPACHGRCERYFQVTLDQTDLKPGQSVTATITRVTREATMGQTLAALTA